MDTFNLKNSLDKLGEEVTKALIAELRAGGKVASGELIKSISFEYVETENGGGIQIVADEYAQNVNDGRKPGHFPTIEPIKRWMAIKGIPKKALYPIMKKIKDKGIKPYPFIDKVLASKSQELMRILEQATTDEIEAYLSNKL